MEPFKAILKKALKFLIHFGGKNIYQKDKMVEYSFTSLSLKKAAEGLMAKEDKSQVT